MSTKTNQKDTKIEELNDSAASIAVLSATLDDHLNSVALTTKEIIVSAVALMRSMLGDAGAMSWFLNLAKTRKITIPEGFDLTDPVNGVNPWLYVCRVLVGFDNPGNWVPNAYAQKNLPGIMRWLWSNSVELDAAGLTTVLETANVKVGKKVLKGLEAAKHMDRSVNGVPRKSSTQVKHQVPREVDGLKPVVSFKADENLFPVDKFGYGIATIRHLGDGKFGVYFGNEESLDVAEIIERSYEFHKTALEKKPSRTVDVSKVSVTRKNAA